MKDGWNGYSAIGMSVRSDPSNGSCSGGHKAIRHLKVQRGKVRSPSRYPDESGGARKAWEGVG